VTAAFQVFADGQFLLRLGVDLLCVLVLIRGVYFRRYGRADLFLSFFGFNLIIFLLAFSLNTVEMSMGAAFGLFAVFSMLRYRTEDISATDMTYLFLVIALGLLMAVADGGLVVLLVIAGLIVGMTALLEGNLLARRELAQDVWYDDVTRVSPARRAELIADLRTRTGLEIHRVEVRQIDLIKDAARLVVYYHPV
jgi:hypothetical protein